MGGRMRHASAALCAMLLAGSALAQQMADPMRPPEFAAAATPGETATAPEVQMIMIAPDKLSCSTRMRAWRTDVIIVACAPAFSRAAAISPYATRMRNANGCAASAPSCVSVRRSGSIMASPSARSMRTSAYSASTRLASEPIKAQNFNTSEAPSSVASPVADGSRHPLGSQNAKPAPGSVVSGNCPARMDWS